MLGEIQRLEDWELLKWVKQQLMPTWTGSFPT